MPMPQIICLVPILPSRKPPDNSLTTHCCFLFGRFSTILPAIWNLESSINVYRNTNALKELIMYNGPMADDGLKEL